MTSAVLLVQGMTLQISEAECEELNPSPLPTMATLDCVARDVTVTGGSKTETDVTTLCSTAKEFRLGLRDSGTMSISGHWKQGHAAHVVIRQADSDNLKRLLVATFSDGSVWKSLAFVSQRSWGASVDGVVSATYNFRLTGDVNEDDPSGN